LQRMTTRRELCAEPAWATCGLFLDGIRFKGLAFLIVTWLAFLIAITCAGSRASKQPARRQTPVRLKAPGG